MILLYQPIVVFGFALACSATLAALAAQGTGHHVPGALPALLDWE